jgi:predicted aminopeptidase
VDSNSIVARPGLLLSLVLLCASSSGCYELQAVDGQVRLLLERRPIAAVIGDPATPAKIRAQLEEVAQIRDFASRALGLPDNGSYRSYADVGRDYVVWNVFAAPEFSVEPKQWCFPFVGCVAYRGYFKESAARAYGERLRREGLDVRVGGVAAYSTLGHFDDPVLSSMLGWDDVELAAIIFHELTHQLLYVPGDVSFNEALATLIEQQGVRRWLTAQGRSADLDAYELEQRRYEEVVDLIVQARAGLAALYASDLPSAQKRESKRAAFSALREAYARRQAQWGAHAPLQSWFRPDVNNADLVSISTYESCVPGFARMLVRADGRLPEFFAAVRALAKLPQAQRDAAVCGPGPQAPA